MNEWMEVFIAQCLADIPWGKYRARTEKELRDHMETLRQSLTEAEVLRAMGDPKQLREEYLAAWQRSWPAQLGHRLKAWGWGCVVMFLTHTLVLFAMGWMDSSLFFVYAVPLVSALMLGAYYLSRKFQASRHPTALVSVGLFFHWTPITAFVIFLQAADHEFRPFWEVFWRQFYYGAGYYVYTLLFCILLGKAVGGRLERRRELA